MDTSKTQFSKGRDGWRGHDEIDMQQTATDYQGRILERKLTISTWKSSRGGIQTVANCAMHGGGFTATDVFGDYRKTVAKLDNRCTEKAVKQLHAAVMEQQADAILAEARAFYVAKDAAKALHTKRDAELVEQDAKKEWSGSPDPKDPDNFWIDDDTGERVNAVTGERTQAQQAQAA